MTNDAATAGCSICAHVAAPQEVVLETDLWLGFRSDRFPWGVVLSTKRHNHGLWTLTPDEAAEYGPLTAQLSAAMVAEWTEHVYVLAYGEEQPHVHVMFMARAVEVSDRSHAAMNDYVAEMRPRESEADAAVARVRDRLARERGTMAVK